MGAASGRCPACERFIGPLEACPYCDCPAERQTGLRVLRLLAVLLAVGGLALLATAAHRRETPSIAVSAIRPSMNFARVRITGALAIPPRSGIARSGEPWFGFTLDDGTGHIRVTGYGGTASALAAVFDHPERGTGALFRVEGWISVRAGQNPSLQVRDPAHVALIEKSP